MNSIFEKDFYPTPSEVIDKMMINTIALGKTVLEPSAGSGNIVDWLQKNGATNVLACETNPKLRAILAQKCDLIGGDFLQLQSEDISHVDLIVMNPPFSADETHIMHAFNIAPAGCEIVALCNLNTVKNARISTKRKQFQELISFNGTWENFGSCFSNSERTTYVEVACVRLFKQGAGEEEFEGYFTANNEEEKGSNGIMSYNVIRDCVNRYVEAIKRFDSVMASADEINQLIKPFNEYGIEFGAFKTSTYEEGVPDKITRDFYKKYLQKRAWKYVFSQMDMDRLVTKKVKETINNFVEKQQHIPFTMKNIYNMFSLIVATSDNRMRDTLVEAFDNICSFSAENSTAGEKWKTNSDYMVNRKFIVPYICDDGGKWKKEYVDLKSGYWSGNGNGDTITDIAKALCYLNGKRWEGHDSEGKRDLEYYSGLSDFARETKMEWGQWYDWGFFRIKGFKKGTMHFEFKDEAVWEYFNRAVAEIKGWQLPKQRNPKKSKETGVAIY